MSAIDLVERLKRRVPVEGRPFKSDMTKPLNPDGPEAADTITRLQAALEKCRDTFRDYERQHQAKAQQIFDDGKTQGLLNVERMAMNARLTKAKANADMADMCDAALSSVGGE